MLVRSTCGFHGARTNIHNPETVQFAAKKWTEGQKDTQTSCGSVHRRSAHTHTHTTPKLSNSPTRNGQRGRRTHRHHAAVCTGAAHIHTPFDVQHIRGLLQVAEQALEVGVRCRRAHDLQRNKAQRRTQIRADCVSAVPICLATRLCQGLDYGGGAG